MEKHFACTGFVVNNPQTKTLLVSHKKLKKWLPPGGHLEKNELPHKGAMREVLEETGVRATCVLQKNINLKKSDKEEQIPSPLCVLLEKIPSNQKEKKHLHIDLIYLLKTKEKSVKIKEDEIENAHWFTKKEVTKCDTFESIRQIALKILN